MSQDRWERIADHLADPGHGDQLEDRGCSLATDLLGVDHAAITIALDGGAGRVTASDTVARSLEEQQVAVGEGPVVDCAKSDWPVLIDDITASRPERPGFALVAGSLGVAAAFSFPLRVGMGRVGSVTGYRDRSGPLSDVQFADGLVLASLLALLLLARFATLPPGTIGPDDGASVQRAAGMVSEQLDVSVADALVILRSQAFVSGTSVGVVAALVISRALDLREEGPP